MNTSLLNYSLMAAITSWLMLSFVPGLFIGFVLGSFWGCYVTMYLKCGFLSVVALGIATPGVSGQQGC
jgi:hypothetical protein